MNEEKTETLWKMSGHLAFLDGISWVRFSSFLMTSWAVYDADARFHFLSCLFAIYSFKKEIERERRDIFVVFFFRFFSPFPFFSVVFVYFL